MPGFKKPLPTGNPRKRLSENASASRIADADEVWHSTAIGDVGDDDEIENCDAFGVSQHSPIKKTKADVAGSNKKKDNSQEKDGARRGAVDSSTKRGAIDPVVIHAPSGHAFFSFVLQKCGYIIRQPVTNNEMYHDVMKFRKTMMDWLKNNDDEMSRVETETQKFYKALDAYLSDKETFVLSMKPTKHETELIQPSLMHCLLGIEQLQPLILKQIMGSLTEASLTGKEEDNVFISSILTQLKWLPMVVDGPKYSKDLLSILTTATPSCQATVMKYLPDVLPSYLHCKVAEELLNIFQDDSHQMNIALMDCFSSMEIGESYWANIRQTAIDQMATASLKDIPAYFSFLFRANTLAGLTEVVEAIREKVTLVPEIKSSKSDAQQVEILEKVGFCIAVNPPIVKVWLKQIKDDINHNDTKNIKKIDLLMLFVFLDASTLVVPVIKMLFAETKLAVDLFEHLMKDNLAMVDQLFSPISKLLDTLLRSREVKCMETVIQLTVRLFTALTPVEAQTLMGNLTGILVNAPPSRDVVLQILTKLVETHPQKLLMFAPHLMGVLEYVMQFQTGQIRSLMNILAILSQTDGKNDINPFTAEFSILLRKQLTHSDLKLRCFGVYGAMASVRQMGEKTPADEPRIGELCKLVWTLVERDEDACNIFLDELSVCSKVLPSSICQTYKDILQKKFEQLWTIDGGEKQKISQFCQRNQLNLQTVFDANKECTEESLLINFENHPLSMSPLVIPAHLRALSLLLMKSRDDSQDETNNMAEIDAILGCPLLFPSLEEYYERESIHDLSFSKRLHLGRYLVLAINFFRESISAFIDNRDPELRVKVWLRLLNILQLQKFLVKHFDSFPSLPTAYIGEKTISSSDGAGPSGLQAFRAAREGKTSKAKPKEGTKKSTKKKSRTELASGSDDEDSNVAPAVQKKTKINFDEEIQPKKIFCYLRRFDKFVFGLLKYPLRVTEENISFNHILLDLSSLTQNQSTMNKVEMLTPATLLLLLTELKRQVQEKQAGFKLLDVKSILRSICTFINQIHAVLLEHEENDMAGITDDQSKLECCLRLLIDLIIIYFEEISKLEEDLKQKHIEKAIKILAKQVVANSDEDGLSSQTEVMANVANYLGQLVSIIKDSATAMDHLKLLKNLHDLLGGNPEMKKHLEEATKMYLKNDWKLPAAKVDGFLKIWHSTSRQPIKVIEHLVANVLQKDEADEDDSYVYNPTVYKSCNGNNFHIWYSAMVSGLSQHAYKNLRRRGDFEDSIERWTEALAIFKVLVAVARKEFKQRTMKTFILIAIMKHSRPFLEAFISGGVELLAQYVKQDRDNAQRFWKAVQVPCRTLQYICEHSKIETDLQLLKLVPLIKRVLETLLFEVRDVIVGLGGATAFEIGSLKHRSLQGVEIHSQLLDPNDVTVFSDEESGDESSLRAAPLSALGDNLDDEDSNNDSGDD